MNKAIIGATIALVIGVVAVVSVVADEPEIEMRPIKTEAPTESTIWASTTIAAPTTTTTVAEIAQPVAIEKATTTTVLPRVKPKTVKPKVVAEAVREAEPEAPKTVLQVAQGEVGKTGPYAEGGFWCAKFISYIAEQAGVPGWVSNDSPARLRALARESGRLHDTPAIGDMVFVDLAGQNGVTDYASHVGIVESVDGNVIHTIEGNASKDSDVVMRMTRQLGDGYVMDFAAFTK